MSHKSVSYKSVPQDCRLKRCPQECPTQDCQARRLQECLTESVPQECRLQQCLTGVSYKGVPQERHTMLGRLFLSACVHSGSWVPCPEKDCPSLVDCREWRRLTVLDERWQILRREGKPQSQQGSDIGHLRRKMMICCFAEILWNCGLVIYEPDNSDA